MTEEQKKELITQAKQLPPRALEIAQQLKLMVSNGQKLASEEILTLASFAYREGLDPLNGECWYIKSKGCMVGIKGLRRKATESLGIEDVWYPEYRDITQTYDLKDDGILYAYECTIRNTRATARWLALQESIDKKNYTAEQIIEIFGHPPVWKGLGIVRKNEYASPTYPQTTRTKKRAEAAAINAMMGFGYEIMDDDNRAPIETNNEIVSEEDESIEGEFTNQETIETESAEVKEIEPKPQRAEQPNKTNGNFSRPMPAEALKNAIAKKAVGHAGKPANDQQRGLMVGMLDTCYAGDIDKRHQACFYLTEHESSKNIPDNYILALLDWLKPEKDSGGAYLPDAMAEREAQSVITQFLLDSGQEKLL